MPKPRALRRYNRTVLLLSLFYAVFLCGAVYGFNHKLLAGPAAYVAAILPALPIIGIFGAIGRYLIEEQDEYVRMLMVRQTLFASGFSLSLATIWGFLESVELVRHVEAYNVAILWFGGLGVGSLVNKLTLGRGV
jgi:hypothetical protein